jgi:hypothetical protein
MPSRFFPIYNIDQPVGPGKANKPDDVRLVQALLVELSRFDRALWISQIPKEALVLATTGVFDGVLEQWILALQKWLVSNFGGAANWKADGVIDPMPLVGSISTVAKFKSGRISTLSMICNRLWKYDRDAYVRIGDEYRVPWIPSPYWED